MGPKRTKVYEMLRGRLAAREYAPGTGFPPSARSSKNSASAARPCDKCSAVSSQGLLEIRGRSSYRVPGSVSVQTPEWVKPWNIYGERDLYDNRWVKLQQWDVEPPGMKSFEHHVSDGSSPASTMPPRSSQPNCCGTKRYRHILRTLS
ncbi:hypothetical protein GA0115241_1043173 [Streptomyces sp. DpondAA-D4]|nr:hypothetical protein GA0115241_1043173 [Streptomyces sp. DpondAA-D4]